MQSSEDTANENNTKGAEGTTAEPNVNNHARAHLPDGTTNKPDTSKNSPEKETGANGDINSGLGHGNDDQCRSTDETVDDGEDDKEKFPGDASASGLVKTCSGEDSGNVAEPTENTQDTGESSKNQFSDNTKTNVNTANQENEEENERKQRIDGNVGPNVQEKSGADSLQNSSTQATGGESTSEPQSSTSIHGKSFPNSGKVDDDHGGRPSEDTSGDNTANGAAAEDPIKQHCSSLDKEDENQSDYDDESEKGNQKLQSSVSDQDASGAISRNEPVAKTKGISNEPYAKPLGDEEEVQENGKNGVDENLPTDLRTKWQTKTKDDPSTPKPETKNFGESVNPEAAHGVTVADCPTQPSGTDSDHVSSCEELEAEHESGQDADQNRVVHQNEERSNVDDNKTQGENSSADIQEDQNLLSGCFDGTTRKPVVSECGNATLYKSFIANISESLKKLETENAEIKQKCQKCESIIMKHNLERKGIDDSLNSVMQELKIKKTTTLAAKLIKFLPATGAEFQENATVVKIKDIFYSIKELQATVSKQQKTIENTKAENEDFRIELNSSLKETANWITKFNEKTAAQTELIKERDEKFKSLLCEYNAMKNYYVEQMRNRNAAMIKFRNDWSNVLKQAKKDLKERDAMIYNHQKKSKELERQSFEKIQSLQVHSVRKEQELQDSKNAFAALQAQMDQEIKKREKVSRKLQNLRDTIRVQEDSLIKEKWNFQVQLDKMSEIIADRSQNILLEDVRSRAENKIITQTVREITKIQNDVKQYRNQIITFEGDREDRTYLHIKEMLLRAVEKLDKIDSQNREEIQSKRKEAIIYVQRLRDELEKRITLGESSC